MRKLFITTFIKNMYLNLTALLFHSLRSDSQSIKLQLLMFLYLDYAHFFF